MQFLSLFAGACLVLTAAAAPSHRDWKDCLTTDQATDLVNDYISILAKTDSSYGNYSQTANAILADTYFESSDSIDSLEGVPLGTITFPNKTAYIASSTFAPPVVGIDTLDIIHSCSKIVWYWKFLGVGSAQFEVKGFNLFYITPGTLQINATFLEFNSIAWGADTGYTTLFPGQKAPPALCS